MPDRPNILLIPIDTLRSMPGAPDLIRSPNLVAGLHRGGLIAGGRWAT